MNFNIKKLMLIFFIAITSFGCEEIFKGDDGDDGDVFIAYYPYTTIYQLETNDPAIYSIYSANGYYYQTEPGTYTYYYETLFYYVNGYYTIEEDEGEDGEILWEDGDDGDDNCFVLWMWSSDADFNLYDCDYTLEYNYYSSTDNDNSNQQQSTTSLAVHQLSAEKEKQIKERIESSQNTVTKTGGKEKYRFVHKYLVTPKTK